MDDLIFIGGKIQLPGRAPVSGALSVKDGLISGIWTETGPDPELWVTSGLDAHTNSDVALRSDAAPQSHPNQYRPAAKVIDLQGAVILPAFIDTHVHMTAYGFDLVGPNLRHVKSLDEALAIIASAAAERPAGSLVWCGGIDPSTIPERRMPTRDELDAVAPDRIVWVCHAEYHAGSGNSACLQYVGIESSAGLPINMPSGVDRDLMNGLATGLLTAKANSQARNRLGELIPDHQRREAIRRTALTAAEHGIATIHAMEGGPLFSDHDVRIMQEMITNGELPVDVVLYWQIIDVAKARAVALPRIGGCVPLDGSIGTHTGAMMEPYSDQPGCIGNNYISLKELDEFVAAAHRAGMQISMHVGGDRSAEMLLQAYEKALQAYPRSDHRHRIEHLEIPRPDHFERAARLGVAVAMQPAFDYYWGQPGGDYEVTLDRERWTRSNALKSALEAGVLVGGGSDAGVTPLDPLLGIHAAVNHHRVDERLSVTEAVKLYTENAARLAFQEHDRGSIAVGKRADLVVLGEDPWEVAPTSIKDIQVMATFRAGKQIFGNFGSLA